MPKVIDETKIFDAALDMLVLHGYEGAATKKIAALAGVNEVTLFRKYGSKATLFEKVIEHYFSNTPLNDLVYTGELEADLLAILDAYTETNEKYGEIVPILLVELHRYPDLQDTFKTPWKNIQLVVQIIQNYHAQGALKPEPVLACLSALIGPVMVNQMFQRANPNLPTPPIDLQTHLDYFLAGRRT